MAKPLVIDPTFFRISKGILISMVVLGYLVTALFSLINKNNLLYIPFTQWAKFTNLLGVLTMIGVLVAEYSLRDEPKMMLVYIALGIVSVSAINLFIIKKKLTTQ